MAVVFRVQTSSSGPLYAPVRIHSSGDNRATHISVYRHRSWSEFRNRFAQSIHAGVAGQIESVYGDTSSEMNYSVPAFGVRWFALPVTKTLRTGQIRLRPNSNRLPLATAFILQ